MAAEVTPAAVVPEATKPVVPEPAVPAVRTSYWYPFEGAFDGAVQPIVALVVVTALALTPVGVEQSGGVTNEVELVHALVSPTPQIRRTHQ